MKCLEGEAVFTAGGREAVGQTAPNPAPLGISILAIHLVVAAKDVVHRIDE